MRTTTGSSGGRPMIMSGRGVVASGHYLATEVGVDILRQGGNAMDAAVAVGFALTVLKPHQNGIGGEVPMLVYSYEDQKVWALSGHGIAPAAATLARFSEMGITLIPGDGFLPALVPSSVASWLLLLRRFGTMRLIEVLSPAVGLARDGFPMYDALAGSIAGSAERFRQEWPSSSEVFLPGGKPARAATLWKQPDWAATFDRLIVADHRYDSREEGLRAAYDEFYRGEIAHRIVEFCRSTSIRDASGESHQGLLSLEDFQEYEARVEDPASTSYRGLVVHKCGTWTQGPVLLQALNLLETFDLGSMGHNSANYIHTVVECMKLAYADREFHYGDPDFTPVPLEWLLSKEYARDRCSLVDSSRASFELRPGGFPPLSAGSVADVNAAFALSAGNGTDGDTTKLEVVDAAGNMVSATPSGGWLMSSPVVPGLGFPLGTRGQMFSLVPGHPNALEPGKRPRTTLTPSLATKEGQPYLVFGSPGGDAQDQWALQFLLNVTEFGMSLQEAVEAPT
ncbi:MAG: gamma-glutamyltransferase family protein, partial [Armatimonadetes bacterium]|nr:gamma-glutamyltransferase family protein [Armatimonadota bacterium]